MKIFLRRFSYRDVKKYYKISHSNTDIQEFVPFAVANSLEDTAHCIEQWANFDFQTEFAFAITLFDDSGKSKVIGAIWANQSRVYNSVYVSYFMAQKYRRNGYTKQAVLEMLEYLSENTSYDSALFDVEPINIASAELVASLGGKNLGLSPDAVLEVFYTYEILL